MRRLSFGYSNRPMRWKIETPIGTILMTSNSESVTIEVIADGYRFKPAAWARVATATKTGAIVILEQEQAR